RSARRPGDRRGAAGVGADDRFDAAQSHNRPSGRLRGMSTGRRAGRPPGAPQPRREQLIALTIELVGAEGYGAATLGRVAERAELSKASVLHHVEIGRAHVRTPVTFRTRLPS